MRNPVWKASTDPLRKAYVNEINVDETGDQTTIYQEITTNTPQLGMTWDSLAPPADYPSLLGQVRLAQLERGPVLDVQLQPVRRVQHGVAEQRQRAAARPACGRRFPTGSTAPRCSKTLGGAETNPALTHILPPGTDGSQDLPANYNPYPYNPTQAKSLLTAAGFTSSHKLNLKYLYRSRQPGRHQAVPEHPVTAERARRRERDRGADQPVGLLRQVPDRHDVADAGADRRLGLHRCGLEPGLVRELGGVLVRPAVLQPRRIPGQRRKQLRLPLRRHGQLAGQPRRWRRPPRRRPTCTGRRRTRRS